VDTIDSTYNILIGGETTNTGSSKNENNESDIVSKLVYIESRLHHLIEVHQYLTAGLTDNDVRAGRVDPQYIKPERLQTAVDVFKFEAHYDKHLKAEKQKKLIQEQKNI
jgi:hypothetical protein